MTNSSQLRLLIVDDERFIRESLKDYLEDCDFEVLAAKSAEEALEEAAKHRYHLAVIDLTLPGRDGEELILKLHSLSPGMRFIINTGRLGYTPSDDLKAVGVQPGHVFYKPLTDLDELVQVIQGMSDGLLLEQS